MYKLYHFGLCPFSRSIRIALEELRLPVALEIEKPWEWRPQFLALNPAGDLPVLQSDSSLILYGAYAISEYLAEFLARQQREHGAETVSPLIPGDLEARAEVRRLVDWFHRKFNHEVTSLMLEEKVYRRFRAGADASPDVDRLRASRANLRYHLSYVGFLADRRNWLAGDHFSFADIAAAAHLSCMDYLGEVAWQEASPSKMWYARMKSRRSVRLVLKDRIAGVSQPPQDYENPDF